MSSTREVAKGIRLPFPCGCLERHSAPNGFEAEEHICETHLAIAAALQHREQQVREACAKIADREHAKLYPGVDYGDEDDSPAYRIAAAIRKEVK